MPRAIFQFQCKKHGCNAVLQDDLYVSDPDFSVEVMSDGDAFECHDVICENCGTEYEIETINGIAGISARINNREIEIHIQHEPDFDDYEEYLLHYHPTDDPFKTYQESCNDLLSLFRTNNSDPTSILNRMAFSQLIAIMEAYLSDKILRLCQEHLEIKKRIAKNAGFIKEQKLSLSDILLDPSKADNLFKISLQKILYHDLDRVEKLYQVALQKNFFPSNLEKETLEQAILTRHDCVHRNGADTNGKVHQFDVTIIKKLASDITILIEHIELKANEAITSLPA